LTYVAASGTVHTQSWQPPSDAARCPSAWGATDERGAGNLKGPELVLRAARLIKAGEVIDLGQILSASMPLNPTRQFDVHTKRTTMNPPSNRRGSNEELVVSEIGQVGTQFDGFAHQTIGDSMYNCFKVSEVATRTGFTKLGIQNVGAIVTRGADRRRGVEERRDAAADLGNHGAGSRAGALEAGPRPAAGRRRDRPHRLGEAVGH
jgi:hypothetical protein